MSYDAKFEDYYLPAVLEAAEYPGLIKQGERVSTIAVPTALVVNRGAVPYLATQVRTVFTLGSGLVVSTNTSITVQSFIA